jgi:hypothetical protein
MNGLGVPGADTVFGRCQRAKMDAERRAQSQRDRLGTGRRRRRSAWSGRDE